MTVKARFGLCGLWIATVLAGLVAAPMAGASPTVDFQLPDLDGREHRLSDYRGNWVLVNFWATWCPPCLEEMPELELFHNNHKERGAMVLGINMEEASNAELRRFLDDQFISFPILRARPDGRTPLGRIKALPTTYIISPEGELVGSHLGPVTAPYLEAFIADFERPRQ